MPASPQLETFTAGVETAVDVAAVERQLHELWQLAAESERDPSHRQVTRACLFNLVAVCETDADRDHATETISQLTVRHPCRAIVLLADARAPHSELGAAISAHCHLAGGGKQVCCEQIAIHAGGAGIAHLGAAVLPLLESDLPTVLWWPGNFLQHVDLFRRLIAVADRLIFDTSQWPDALESLGALARTIAAVRGCRFADLSWTRLGLWRRLAAEMFDEPHCRAELAQLASVEVLHGWGPGAALRARLYAGWIAGQLGWSVATAKARTRLNTRDDRDATSVGILAVTLRSAAATFTVRKNHGQRTATAHVEMPDICGLPRTRAFWPTDDASLLSQELDHPLRHSVYERALAMSAAMD
jgi:glucose-6-phosphate dehydrogenase assembly protein OpcA